MEQISYEDFLKVEIIVGTIKEVFPNKKAKKNAYWLTIDFGNKGIKKSSAQITQIYTPEDLIEKQICAVLNFPAKQITDGMSECLVLGIVESEGVKLLVPDGKVKNGSRIL